MTSSSSLTSLCSALSSPASSSSSSTATNCRSADQQPLQAREHQADVPTSSAVSHLAHLDPALRQSALLATAQARLLTPLAGSRPFRVLLDSGSELSFITNKLVLQLKLQRQRSNLLLTGIGNVAAGRSKGRTIITLGSLHSTAQIDVQVHILPSLTTVLPSFNVDSSSWTHLNGLQLADLEFRAPGSIDIILGLISFTQVIMPQVKRARSSDPIALHTLFGWIIFGPVQHSSTLISSPALHVKQDHDLHELLSRFWLQEETSKAPSAQLAPDEEACETYFTSTHSRDTSGRYVVRLPLLQPSNKLGESRKTALRHLKTMLKRLSLDQRLDQLYRDFMDEYLALGHIRLAPEAHSNSPSSSSLVSSDRFDEMTLTHDASASGGLRVSDGGSLVQAHAQSHFYLPHHGVLREHSLTTKLRVVFNGSARTSSGSWLNDILHTGAKLQRDIFDVLLWIRTHKILFSSDITKMLRQINVHPDDWDLQRIVWLDEYNNIVPYQLTTVTYGTRTAPFLAVRVLLQLVQDEDSKYPRSIAPMTKGRYVDDSFGGSDTLQEAQLIAQDLINLCKAGSFRLTKWSSNSPALLQALSLKNVSSAPVQALDDTELKVLGLSWSPSSDEFIFSPRCSMLKKLMKRTVLSEVAQLFDPLGFLAPVIVRAKMFIQELWLNKSGWDDEFSTQLSHRWTHLREELSTLAYIRIPRWLNMISSSYIELHGFSDASQLAVAACIYIRVVNPGDQAQVQLLCAKTKVASLKPVTIPRLELTAAWMLSKLIKQAQQALELAHAPVYLWTDSSVALNWILTHPSKWKEFVKNRVVMIQELNPTAKWLYVPGKQNPADCASRGLAPAQLINNNLWRNGPEWLTSSQSSWPAQNFKPSALAHKEERPGVLLHATKAPEEQDHPLWGFLSGYSTLYKLLRITALCKRFCAILKKETSLLYHQPLTPQDQLDVQLLWVRIIQHIHFSSEIKALQSGLQLPTTHFMSKFTTLLAQIEAVLNTRPLTSLSDDPTDLTT